MQMPCSSSLSHSETRPEDEIAAAVAKFHKSEKEKKGSVRLSDEFYEFSFVTASLIICLFSGSSWMFRRGRCQRDKPFDKHLFPRWITTGNPCQNKGDHSLSYYVFKSVTGQDLVTIFRFVYSVYIYIYKYTVGLTVKQIL